MDSPELDRPEAKVSSQGNGVQPEFCRLIIPIHVDVRRFVRLMAIEVHPVRAYQQDGRHEFSISLSVELQSTLGRVRDHPTYSTPPLRSPAKAIR
jgi:hypothetical protein